MDKKLMSLIESNTSDGILFVLKGFPLSKLNIVKTKLKDVIKNKVSRLLQLTNQQNQVIAYDEFICLYDILIIQYNKVFILENPVYYNLFPIDAELDKDISGALLNHFDPDADENAKIGYLHEYTNIYSNYILTEQGLACCYNIDESLIKHEKIEKLTLGKQPLLLLERLGSLDKQNYINICNDNDYYQLVRMLYTTDRCFYVTWENYISGKVILQRKLEILCAQFPNRVYAYLTPITTQETKSIKEIFDLMEKYWGYKSYRNFKVYDLAEVSNGNKKVVSISQEKVINDIVEQVERCLDGKSFRDVFVTAPTGSGKSLMFQLPAMYLAKKYNLVTLVITPLIGLMNDQVNALSRKGYTEARTINSDISPIVRQEILTEVSEGKCHILYLSPESLLSRSDIKQLIGTRRIGLIVVDEAHIVTTWGKQFRPDYWYLGEHVQKIRRVQARHEKDPSPFIISTFTATAIYEGQEDMYHETLNSLHMIDPITYLGYVRRKNISIEISEVEVKRNKTEYEINKFDSLVTMLEIALMRNQKTLIYFPTVALINRFYSYCYSKNLSDYVTKYNGQMDATKKNENFQSFLNGSKMVMLATKAFGMGIDIPDISIVSHFAPTGNVCDYMQEIGRAARDSDILGHAVYKHMSSDFKHINRLHGLSAIQKYQLIEVIKKVLEIYINVRYKSNGRNLTKKRNEMLVDAESFAYIFEGPNTDENNLINKVKTSLLLIQKDYENRGFAPFYIRPIPLFAYGYFSISPKDQVRLNRKYHNAVKLIHYKLNVCEVNLKRIWEKSYSESISFPKFKYLLYSNSSELDFNQEYSLAPAMSVEVFFNDNVNEVFSRIFNPIKNITHTSIYKGKYISLDELNDFACNDVKISRYHAESIISVIIAAMGVYQRDYCGRMNTQIYKSRVTQKGKVSYQFLTASREFFVWLENGLKFIQENTNEQKLYIVNSNLKPNHKEIITILGILESFGVLRFKSLGGSNSQIYIYVNETKTMQMVRDKPGSYKNKLLDLINSRHSESVKMLSFLFQNEFSSDEVWSHLENYFLGILPDDLKAQSEDISEVEDTVMLFQIGENLKEDYSSWNEANTLFDNSEIALFDQNSVPFADYYAAKLIIGKNVVELILVWTEEKLAITSGDEGEELREIAECKGWVCIPLDSIKTGELLQFFRG